MAPRAKKAAAAASSSATDAAAAPDAIKEQDVLMGRGKRISEWPGNIHFRQVVNRHREEYHKCTRKEKVKVANTVLEDIQAIGGRFLQQTKGDKWEEVEYERAIEKACQALREKEKSRPPETSPFEGAKPLKPPVAPPSVRPASNLKRPTTSKAKVTPKKRNGKGTNPKAKSKKDDDKSTTSDEESTSADESGNEEESGEEASSDDGNETAVWQNFRDKPDEQFLPRLEAFKEKHGHCAVTPHDCLSSPGDDSDDSDLANWCTVQRQIYREIKSEYRKATEGETKRIEKLDKLGFCWDYEKWHWEQSFQILQEETQEATKKKVGLTDEALLWALEQRSRGKRGMAQNSTERAKKLKSVNVLVT